MQQTNHNSHPNENSIADKATISFKYEGLRIHAQQGQHNLLALHQAQTDRYPFFLESVANAIDEGCSSRFDILFAFPQETLCLNNDEKLEGDIKTSGNNFLDNLNHWWSGERKTNIWSEVLPFTGGWFLYLGYELA
ncbi:MAG: hypothetical protein OEW97_09175, partial [Gammaproteobacteria bacterium]|nr:hypothetical protein [Gammaproteobacteria bacterium]